MLRDELLFFYFIITTVSQSAEQHVTSLPYIYTASLSAPAVGGKHLDAMCRSLFSF